MWGGGCCAHPLTKARSMISELTASARNVRMNEITKKK